MTTEKPKVTDPLYTWRTPDTPPLITTDQDPSREMLLELEDGYKCSGEYEHATGKFLAYVERFDEEDVPSDPDLINQSLEFVLEEVNNVRHWMWLLRPTFT